MGNNLQAIHGKRIEHHSINVLPIESQFFSERILEFLAIMENIKNSLADFCSPDQELSFDIFSLKSNEFPLNLEKKNFFKVYALCNKNMN